jgi:hypothetical protein
MRKFLVSGWVAAGNGGGEGGVCDFDSWLLLFCLIMNFPEHRNRMLELE